MVGVLHCVMCIGCSNAFSGLRLSCVHCLVLSNVFGEDVASLCIDAMCSRYVTVVCVNSPLDRVSV